MVRTGIYMRRRTRKLLIYIPISIIIVLAAMTAVFFATREYMYDKVEQDRSKLEQEMEANIRTVYIAKANIRQGELLDIANIETSEVYASMQQELFVTDFEKDKYALCDIPIGSYLQNCMVTDSKTDSCVREVEYTDIVLSRNLCEGDCVDVRLYLPDGSNMVIIAKKNISFHPENDNMDYEKLCYFNLSEDEINNMSLAKTVAQDIDGALLFTTKYIDPMGQKTSEVTNIRDIMDTFSETAYKDDFNESYTDELVVEEDNWLQ